MNFYLLFATILIEIILGKNMGTIETVLKYSKKIESSLNDLGSEGKGIHQKVSSIEKYMDSNLVKKIRYIGTVRNKSVHEEDYKVENLDNFIEQARYVLSELSIIYDKLGKESEYTTEYNENDKIIDNNVNLNEESYDVATLIKSFLWVTISLLTIYNFIKIY